MNLNVEPEALFEDAAIIHSRHFQRFEGVLRNWWETH